MHNYYCAYIIQFKTEDFRKKHKSLYFNVLKTISTTTTDIQVHVVHQNRSM